ncbi:pteridine reductase [Oceanimonas baumannii]|uniref:Pteridine reductase n=1 Tax=Oceanimonas baumannii TaxID=129578 RepID=A0A235CH45_9GAMM|nr:pteridine reductase [Oceanimonas baumannii]OYD23860.1 pteridine reductase [Oceanimonas baumannii]TDW58814.1 pteridine reductase [Oceanimonas baumannii]
MPPVVLLTGAARRIGAEISRCLHARGFNLVLHYHNSEAQAGMLANELNTVRPNSVQLLQQDLTQLDAINAMADRALGCFGRISALINNASAFYPTRFGEITPTQWLELSATNAVAPLLLSQALLPSLQQEKGNIVNMVDIHAANGLRDHLPYSMAKNALMTLTRALAAELAPLVRVNGIAPGPILWPEHELNDVQKQRVLASVPMGRLGTPGEIADTVAFLLEGPAYLTGQIIALDGGRSCQSLPDA